MSFTCGHPSDEDIENYLVGTVVEEFHRMRIEKHLLVCEGCLNRAMAIGETVDLMKEAFGLLATAPRGTTPPRG